MSPKRVLYGDAQRWGLVQADALDLLKRLPARSVDSVVVDPPYAIGFGGHDWDGVDIRRVAGEALSPGHAFERWTTLWAQECRRLLKPGGHIVAFGSPRTFHRLVSGVEDAGLEIRDQLLWIYGTGVPKSRRMSGGQGTGLKPAFEPIALARAPLTGTVTANLTTWGTGTLGIDPTRVGEGRFWPANVLLSHAPGCSKHACAPDCPFPLIDRVRQDLTPSRLLFSAKATRQEREAGCEELPERLVPLYRGRTGRRVRNPHPTVKPRELMQWLVRLVTPPGGVVMDPFTGSGSTGIAALLEGRQFLGVEREAEYVTVARARLAHWARVAAKESAR
jgi:DNA modification methylase